MAVRFVKYKDWKEKLLGFCPCFTGGQNKIGLNKNYDVCNCNANELKFILLSKKKIKKIDIFYHLIKLNIFTKKQCIQAVAEITNSVTNDFAYVLARRKLKENGYKTFYTKQATTKTYDRSKI